MVYIYTHIYIFWFLSALQTALGLQEVQSRLFGSSNICACGTALGWPERI